MAYLLVGALALWLLLKASGKRIFPRREWRFLSMAVSLVALAGAAYSAVEAKWEPALVLLLFGAWFALSSRQPPGSPAAARQAGPPPSGAMSPREARDILGVAPGATREDVQAAYLRLMRSLHPDKGGTKGLAAQINAARDILLGR
jgi:hypothetical protein